MIMFLFLFALWLLLNGRVTLEICLFGVVVAGAVYAFSVYALGFHPSHEKRLLKRLGGYIAYAAVLIWEIIKANMPGHPDPAPPLSSRHCAGKGAAEKEHFPGDTEQFHYPDAGHRDH